MVLHGDAMMKRVDLNELLCAGPSDMWLMDPEAAYLLSAMEFPDPLAQVDSNSVLANISSSGSLKSIDPFTPGTEIGDHVKLEADLSFSKTDATDAKPQSRPASAHTERNGPPPKRRRNTITAAAVRDAISRTQTTSLGVDVSSPDGTYGDIASLPSTPKGGDQSSVSAASVTVFAGKPMSKDELLKLENKLEKNRQMAKEARRKKKEYVQTLEERISGYQQTIATLQQRLAESEQRNASLATELALVKSSITGAHTQSNSSLLNLATAQVAHTLLTNLGPALLPYLAANASQGPGSNVAPTSTTHSGNSSSSTQQGQGHPQIPHWATQAALAAGLSLEPLPSLSGEGTSSSPAKSRGNLPMAT